MSVSTAPPTQRDTYVTTDVTLDLRSLEKASDYGIERLSQGYSFGGNFRPFYCRLMLAKAHSLVSVVVESSCASLGDLQRSNVTKHIVVLCSTPISRAPIMYTGIINGRFVKDLAHSSRGTWGIGE